MSSAADSAGVVISRFELLWITLGMWVGGVSILTLAPLLLIPRVGIPLGMGGSYLLFFLAWHPVQAVTQRVLGTGTAVARMIAFVGGGAVVAYYLREALLTMAQG